ncbi:MAG TPA: IS4 family transposase [Isosphaeraceae bacterium]|nr:IS4 family transposase [Isosphaeraceae bacterium]
MAHPTTPRLRAQIHRLGNPKAPQPELGLEAVLPKATVERVLKEEGGWWKAILSTPWVTFWAFFWQRLSADRSGRAALKRLAAWMALHGRRLDDEDTGPYCKARARLPESALHRLMRELGAAAHHGAATAWLWCCRRVKMVDGSTAIMADTVANQRTYPQLSSQKPGLGFPIARFVVIFCLATGSVLEAALGQYQGKQTGENALFRSLWDELEPGDVVLGDRYFGSYFDIALLKQRGVDSVFRLHQRRKCDFRRGQRLGREDQIVHWDRPARPDWMDEATYDRVDETMAVRIIRIRVEQRGFRTRVLEVVTTLLDADIYTKKDIAILYRKRWHAELDLRSIQVVLGMDLLLSKTPEMVRKEIWMTLLGYNVVRALMVKAGLAHHREVRRLSFKGALQTVPEFGPGLRGASPSVRPWLWRVLLSSIAQDAEGYRPDRAEPRARKRRPKPYPLLTKPRKQAKAALLRAG